MELESDFGYDDVDFKCTTGFEEVEDSLNQLLDQNFLLHSSSATLNTYNNYNSSSTKNSTGYDIVNDNSNLSFYDHSDNRVDDHADCIDGSNKEKFANVYQAENKQYMSLSAAMDSDSSEDSRMDWLDSLLDDPVLNDRMMTDALQPPRIQSEHSYSLGKSGQENVALVCQDVKEELISTPSEPPKRSLLAAKQEVPTPIKQPTIIVATTSILQSNHQQSLLVPTIKTETRNLQTFETIKVEPCDNGTAEISVDTLSMPPTPPSSSNSDSEGGASPGRSTSPMMRHTQVFVHHQSGHLLLTDEEKRTLIAEGYPIPSKLPLTKQEEKNLKKIRRKIKNKISAQESRRKKKEYLETLEKRVEVFNQENVDLKKKVDSLENNNRSLLSQLSKLQSLIYSSPALVNPTQTCLMVFVLFFALFLGSWSMGGSSLVGNTSFIHRGDRPVCTSPKLAPFVADPYSTPNIRSRVLLSLKDEQDDPQHQYGPPTPFSYKDLFLNLFEQKEEAEEPLKPILMSVQQEPDIPQTTIVLAESALYNKSEGELIEHISETILAGRREEAT